MNFNDAHIGFFDDDFEGCSCGYTLDGSVYPQVEGCKVWAFGRYRFGFKHCSVDDGADAYCIVKKDV